ncbi:platelet-derived growth factor receptor-like protein [Pontoporia blainvillei]|uniref:Platelet-derived growth factor receptor-like protein n=1 Tax=Pontoporia blainvillei TaxID=48723 RepID=A0ABX0S5Y2_PONBL|nr:platelet-derived growth factor receptor-like protein [Pontoporia blainvillei]
MTTPFWTTKVEKEEVSEETTSGGEVPSGPPSTTILASANKVKGGDDISVLCTVLGEPDVEVEFRWIYPGQKDERPVTIQDTWRLIHRGLGHTTRISQSVLIVEDFEMVDAGFPKIYTIGSRPWFIWKAVQHLEDELALDKAYSLSQRKSRKEVKKATNKIFSFRKCFVQQRPCRSIPTASFGGGISWTESDIFLQSSGLVWKGPVRPMTFQF